MKIRKLKNTYINLRKKYIHKITEEYEEEKYLNKMLEEALIEYEIDNETIPFEIWQEEMRIKYNVRI